MDYQKYEKEFRYKAKNTNYSEEEIQVCLNYAKSLLDKKLPIIFNTSHFSRLVGYNRNYIKRAVAHTPFFYRTFKIPKKDGKLRTISEPLPSLKEIQNWILINILYQIPISKFAKAYTPDKNIIDNVSYHKKQVKLLSLDIQNFFSSIHQDKIEIIFKTAGYSKLIANLLAKLCTCEKALPEGAPTSPYLSNLILKEFDEEIYEYYKKHKIKYTRYADDLTFSAKEFEEEKVIQQVKYYLAKEGLELNEKKTKLMLPNQRQMVTGIVVNQKLQVPKEKRKELRQAIYYIKKFGLKDHLRYINSQKRNYLKHLLGTANFILFINKEDKETQEYKTFLIDLLKEEEKSRLKESINNLLKKQIDEDWQSDFSELKQNIPEATICLTSASAYYDLTTFIPSKHHISIPKKSNVRKDYLPKIPEYPPVEVFYWSEQDYDLGQIKVEIEDVEVMIYDIEKTVCDMIKYHKQVGWDIAIETLKNYLKLKNKNIVKLSEYAKELGIFDSLMSKLLTTLLI